MRWGLDCPVWRCRPARVCGNSPWSSLTSLALPFSTGRLFGAGAFPARFGALVLHGEPLTITPRTSPPSSAAACEFPRRFSRRECPQLLGKCHVPVFGLLVVRPHLRQKRHHVCP